MNEKSDGIKEASRRFRNDGVYETLVDIPASVLIGELARRAVDEMGDSANHCPDGEDYQVYMSSAVLRYVSRHLNGNPLDKW